MKGALGVAGDEITGQLVSIAVSLAAIGIVGWILYRKLFSSSGVVTQGVQNVIQSSSDLVSGLPGAISDTLTGTNAGSYVSPAQARANDAAALAAHNALLLSQQG